MLTPAVATMPNTEIGRREPGEHGPLRAEQQQRQRRPAKPSTGAAMTSGCTL